MDVAHAEQAAQLSGLHLHRPRRRRRTGRGLREGRRPRRVEGDVPLDLLEHLVDVTVESRDRAEAAQHADHLLAVGRGPAPCRIHGPERHVGEDDEGGARRERLEILPQPVELLVTESAAHTRLVRQHVHETDEVDAAVVERSVAAVLVGAGAVAAQEFLAAIDGHVVLAGDVDDLLRPHGLQRLRERVEGAGLLSVGQVARVQHERRTRLERVEARDGVAQRAHRVLVGLAAEADVRVADLSEREVGAGGRRLAEHRRGQHAAARGPHQSGPGPGQALHEASPFHGILLRRRHFTTTVAVMWGCRAQKYVYVPGVVKRCAYVSLRSSPLDVYARSVPVTVCGSSSPLTHATVAPTRTVSSAGTNLNSLICTLGGVAASATAASATAATRVMVRNPRVIVSLLHMRQRADTRVVPRWRDGNDSGARALRRVTKVSTVLWFRHA